MLNLSKMLNNRKNVEKWTIILRDKATSITKLQYVGTIKKGKSWNSYNNVLKILMFKICNMKKPYVLFQERDRKYKKESEKSSTNKTQKQTCRMHSVGLSVDQYSQEKTVSETDNRNFLNWNTKK